MKNKWQSGGQRQREEEQCFTEEKKYKQSNVKAEKNNILGSDENGGRNMPESVIQASIFLSTH